MTDPAHPSHLDARSAAECAMAWNAGEADQDPKRGSTAHRGFSIGRSDSLFEKLLSADRGIGHKTARSWSRRAFRQRGHYITG